MKRARFIYTVILLFALLVAGTVSLLGLRSDPQTVFTDMLRNNLSTSGVTRVVTQEANGLQLTQYTQLNLGEQPSAHALTIFAQSGGKIVTEQMSTRGHDVVRYREIVTDKKGASGKPIDVSGVVGKWAELKTGDSLSSAVTSGLFDQAVLGVVPMGNLEPETRADIMTYLERNEVFSFDAKSVKTVTVAGHKALHYSVSIRPVAYIGLMQRFGKLLGANEYAGLDPASYAGSSSVAVTMDIDARSHQLLQLKQADSAHVESYEGYGISTVATLPKATLTTSELEQRIGNLR